MKDWKFILEKYILRQHRAKTPEPLVRKRMKKIHGIRFVDIGCNKKAYANLLRNNFESIVTIDPNPKWNADLQIALSNFDGQEIFHIITNTGSADSLVQRPHILGKDWTEPDQESFNVEVKRFDSIKFSPLNLPVDLAKIDVEGAEFEVIDGMRKNPPRNLMVELHDERRELELDNLMRSLGYLVTKVDDTHFFGERLGS